MFFRQEEQVLPNAVRFQLHKPTPSNTLKPPSCSITKTSPSSDPAVIAKVSGSGMSESQLEDIHGKESAPSNKLWLKVKEEKKEGWKLCGVCVWQEMGSGLESSVCHWLCILAI